MPRLILAFGLSLVAALPGTAQPLETFAGFLGQVARAWASADADALAALADGEVLLGLGAVPQAVGPRHAAAALRVLLDDMETLAVRVEEANVTGAGRAFGTLAWTARPRGLPIARTQRVYVGAVWRGDRWRLRELRLWPGAP